MAAISKIISLLHTKLPALSTIVRSWHALPADVRWHATSTEQADILIRSLYLEATEANNEPVAKKLQAHLSEYQIEHVSILWHVGSNDTGRMGELPDKHLVQAVITPDHQYFVAAYEGTAVVQDMVTGRWLHNLASDATTQLRAIAVTPDSRFAITGCNDATVRVFDLATGRQTAVFYGHEGPVVSLAVTPDGRFVVTGSDDSTVRVFDLTTGSQVHLLSGHEGSIQEIEITAFGCIVTTSWLDGVRAWNLITGELLHIWPDINSAAITPGVILVSKGLTFRLSLSSERLVTSSARSLVRSGFAIAPNGRYVVSSGHHQVIMVEVWDLDVGKCVGRDRLLIRSAREYTGIYKIGISSDSSIAIVLGVDDTIAIWRLPDAKLLATFKAEKSVESLAVSPSVPGVFVLVARQEAWCLRFSA